MWVWWYSALTAACIASVHFLVASCDRKAFALETMMYLLLPSAGSAERSQISWWHEGINLQLNACRGGPAVGRLYEEIC